MARHTLALGASLLLALSACTTMEAPDGIKKTAEVLQQDKTQVAILMNPGGGLSAVGVETGARFIDCGPVDGKDGGAARGNPACMPPDHGELLYKKVIEIEVRKGTACVNIISGGRIMQLCSPPLGPYPEAFILSLLPH